MNRKLRRALAKIAGMGIFTAEHIREAFEGDLRQLQDLLTGKIREVLELSGEDEWWPYVRALFSDFIIVEDKHGKLQKYTYSIDGTDVTLSNPEEVVLSYEPVKDNDGSPFMEAADEAGSKYKIRVISAGLSLNDNYYTDDVLRAAVPLFEGARVFVKSDAEHLQRSGKDVRNIIGSLSDAAFVEGSGEDSGEIQATFNVLQPNGDVGVTLKEAWDRGMSNLFGFSIDANAIATHKVRDGVRVTEAVQFHKINSVDLIVEPGAGGAVLTLLEAKNEEPIIMDRDELIALLESKGILTRADAEKLSDAQLKQRLTESVADQDGGDTLEGGDGDTSVVEAAPAPTGTPASGDGVDVNQLTTNVLEAVNLQNQVEALVNASTLPGPAKTRMIESLKQRTGLTIDQVKNELKQEITFYGSIAESGTVTGLGAPFAQVGDSNLNAVTMLEAFFDTEHKDHKHAQSIKSIYGLITGDTNVTGRMQNVDRRRMTEAFSGAAKELGIFLEAIDSGTFGSVLGSVMHRRMLAYYNAVDQFSVWRKLATVTAASDFRTRHVTRYGGYGDIPVVGEAGDYTALTSPTDEEATYAVQKRGGTETLTIEAIKNDDVLALRQIPMKLGSASKRTLAKFVLDFMRLNNPIYDGVNLFHASHGNLGTAALAKASLAAARLRMLKQTEMDTGEQTGLPAKTLWVAPEGQEEAENLFFRGTENDKDFTGNLGYEVVPVWYWTDPDDWFLTADPMLEPFIELAFLDGNSEPEIFIQDDPKNGSLFSNDQIIYKLRQIYGATVVNFRPAQGNIVP